MLRLSRRHQATVRIVNAELSSPELSSFVASSTIRRFGLQTSKHSKPTAFEDEPWRGGGGVEVPINGLENITFGFDNVGENSKAQMMFDVTECKGFCNLSLDEHDGTPTSCSLTNEEKRKNKKRTTKLIAS